MGVNPRCYAGGHRALVNFIYLAKARQEKSLFRDPLRRAFMERIALCDSVECEIFTLETASALVAAIVTFRDRDVRRFYTTYFAEAWSRYSPGAALLFHATERSLAEGLACDYMTGEHNYKLRLATGIVPLYRLPRIRLDHFYAERELALAG
jgi:CelD/BcsL family acetyltransferase involved in cellulose biosynthesis